MNNMYLQINLFDESNIVTEETNSHQVSM